MPLPAVAGTVVKDIDPATFGLADNTALTFANSGLTPVTGSPTFKSVAFDTGVAGIRCVRGASGFSVARPVQDDFSIYAVIKMDLGEGTSTDFFRNGSLIDAEAPFVANDWGVNLSLAGNLVAGVGNPDTSGTGSATIIGANMHYLSIVRTKATGTFKVYVDGVLDVNLTGNTNSLTGPTNISFASGTSTGKVGGIYGRVVFYDAAHNNTDRASVESYLATTYADSKMVAYKSETYGVLGPPLILSCTKSVMYVITGPGRQRIKVRLLKSIPVP